MKLRAIVWPRTADETDLALRWLIRAAKAELAFACLVLAFEIWRVVVL